jgi:nitroimidazol reductase NimA-like FMN-containing flavoprotein (pyridoxamine 5'-phosphate oxidase superfamily)
MSDTLTDSQMNELLTEEIFGHLACSDNGKPYVIPMAYVFIENVLYGQTTSGKKVEMMRKNPLVCFQVEQLKDNRWRSVMCWGMFEELDFAQLKEPQESMAVEILTQRIAGIQQNVGVSVPFSFSQKARPLTVNEKQSTLFRIVIQEKSGRVYVPEKQSSL